MVVVSNLDGMFVVYPGRQTKSIDRLPRIGDDSRRTVFGTAYNSFLLLTLSATGFSHINRLFIRHKHRNICSSFHGREREVMQKSIESGIVPLVGREETGTMVYVDVVIGLTKTKIPTDSSDQRSTNWI